MSAVLKGKPAAEDEASTVVSDPNIPSDIEATICRRPEVCVCDTCEAARLRLIHRMNKKKRSRDSVDQQQQQQQQPATKKTSTDLVVANDNKISNINSTTTKPIQEDDYATRLLTMTGACKTILRCIGEDECREGLIKTPERWAKALLFMCNGYTKVPADVINGAVFEENHDEMVVVRNIDIHSLCEHHMVPFTGRVHIGYIPNGKILGLSKLARIAELFARRLQVQERLTRQIADAIVETVEPLGVAVVMECSHFCMVMRGVQKTGAITTTSSVRGCFESNPKTRAEFFSIIHGNGIKMC